MDCQSASKTTIASRSVSASGQCQLQVSFRSVSALGQCQPQVSVSFRSVSASGQCQLQRGVSFSEVKLSRRSACVDVTSEQSLSIDAAITCLSL